MMKRTILLMAVCLCFMGRASAQWVVSDPGNLAQGIINTAKQIVETAGTKANTLNGFLETQKIFQQGKAYYDALKSVHDVVKGRYQGEEKHRTGGGNLRNLRQELPNHARRPVFHGGRAGDHILRLCHAAGREFGRASGLEKCREHHGHVSDGCRTAGNHRQCLPKPDELPQSRELLHPQEHFRVLPAGKEKERHRPGAGSLRLGG